MQLKSEAFAVDNNLWYIVIDTAILVGEAVSKEPRGCIMTLNVVLITKAALARKLFQYVVPLDTRCEEGVGEGSVVPYIM